MADKLKQIRETQHQRKFTRQDLIKYGFYCCQLPYTSPNLSSLGSAHWLWNYGSFHAVDRVAVEELGGRGAQMQFLAGMETKPSPSKDSPSPSLCVEMGFYANISWKSRCNIEINVWAHFYKILLVFEVPYWPQSCSVSKETTDVTATRGIHLEQPE